MSRVAICAIWLGLFASISLFAQQDAQPVLPGAVAPAQSDTQPVLPGAVAPAQPAESRPRVNPKTGLPYTPAELREMEIDKYDPMKRNVDPVDDANLPTDRMNPAARPGAQRRPDPLPGSIEATAAAQADPRRSVATLDPDEASAAANGAEYTGPAVLSRSYTLARPMIPSQIRWAASGGLSYAWSSGQAPGATNGNTSYQSVATQSIGASWAASGRHIWKRDQAGLSYTGNYSKYVSNSLNGLNHSLNLDYGHVFSRRLSVHLVEGLQDLSQNYSLENPTLAPGNSVANLNLASSPDVQLLNSQTLQSSTSVSVTYRPTARLSYNASTSYFIIGRTEGVGMRGKQYSGDVNYRVTRKMTIGSYYSFSNYVYSHNISTSDSHGMGAIFSYALNRSTQIQSRFGITRIESLAFSAVPLPPALAAILGQPTVVINAYSLRRTSDISVQLVRDFRRTRTFSLAYAQGQSPGNGILLTSIQRTISAGFSTRLFRRRFPISTGVTHSSVESASQGNIGFYKSDTLYFSTSRSVGGGASATFSFSYLRYNVSQSPLRQDSLRVSMGITWGVPQRFLRKL